MRNKMQKRLRVVSLFWVPLGLLKINCYDKQFSIYLKYVSSFSGAPNVVGLPAIRCILKMASKI